MQTHSQQAHVIHAARQSSPLETTRLGNRSSEFKSLRLLKHVSKTASTIKAVPFCKKRAFFISIHKRKKIKREKLISQLIASKRKSSTPRRTSNHISSADNHQSRALHSETEKGKHIRTQKLGPDALKHETMARSSKSGTDTEGKKQNKSRKQSSPKKKDQGHHFRCLPKTIATMYNECLRRDAEKMALIEELGFGAFSHLPSYNLKQHMLKELVNIFNIHDNTIHSVRGDVEITTDKIGKALGKPFDDKVYENDLSDEDHAIFKMFQGKSQAELTMPVKTTPVDTEANRNLFKRVFLIFIQKVLLLPTSSPNVTPKALPTLFGLENTGGRNWALHVHDFLLEELKKAKLNNTKAIHGCCYVIMIIYFYKTHFGKNAREPEAQPPWI
ncbi:hypothetical protein PIB30_026922 [Stylosanthes scabra]|uniref:Uncharacterized protein n=1 Tax=Stylosanthes scabra TaxID=79078 RepID=A0ABU6XC12_9FABA|nr:hypothetical protein [Stylosanthes scabra]